jgi:hypothetical protein
MRHFVSGGVQESQIGRVACAYACLFVAELPGVFRNVRLSADLQL